jgi:hypothetical protein
MQRTLFLPAKLETILHEHATVFFQEDTFLTGNIQIYYVRRCLEDGKWAESKYL